jgi:hypothetical protein
MQADRTCTFATVVYRFSDGQADVATVNVDASSRAHTIPDSCRDDGELVIVGPYKLFETLTPDQPVLDGRTPTTAAASQPTTARGG